MAIIFPSTVGKPTDGSFRHTHKNKTWSWNGKTWTSVLEPSLTFNQEENELKFKSATEETSVILPFSQEEELNSVDQKYDSILRQSLDLDSEGNYTGVVNSSNNVKGDITQINDDKISLNQKGIAGGVATLDFSGNLVQERVTSLSISGNTLTFVDEEQVSHDISLPYDDPAFQETVTSLSLDSENNLVYTDESGSTNQVVLPYITPQDISIDGNGDLVYNDGLGNSGTIPLPSQSTQLSLDNQNNLVYTDEKGQSFTIGWEVKDAVNDLFIENGLIKYTKLDGSSHQVELPHQDALINLKLENNILKADRLSGNTDDRIEINLEEIVEENLTQLYVSTDQENLIFVDELGNQNVIPLPEETLTSLQIIRYISNDPQDRWQLKFKDEGLNEHYIILPRNVVTSLDVDPANKQFIYTDEDGVENSISISETNTQLSSSVGESGGRTLIFTDELGNENEIQIIPNALINNFTPSQASVGDLWFDNYTYQHQPNLKIYDGSDWKDAVTVASRFQSGSNSVVVTSDEVNVNSNLNVVGNLEITGGDISLQKTGTPSKIYFGDNYLTVKDYDKDEPTYTPRVEVVKGSDTFILTNSSSDDVNLDSPLSTKIIDTTKTHHFLNSMEDYDEILLYWGNYVGQELFFHIKGGNVNPSSHTLINVWKSKYPNNFSMQSFEDYAGYHSSTSNMGQELSNLSSYNIVSDSGWKGWGLYNIRPLHRNFDDTQPSGSEYKWAFVNVSEATYSCIWDGNNWILNGGTILNATSSPIVPGDADYSIPAHILLSDSGGN